MPRRGVFTSWCGVISTQHVTLTSRILIRRPADERWATGLHRKNHRNHRRNQEPQNRQSSTDHLLVTKTSGQRPSHYERVVATEPHAIRRRDTRNPPAAARPAPRIDDTPTRQAASGKKKLRPERPDALDTLDVSDATCLTRTQIATASAYRTERGRAFSFWTQPCQGIFLLDASGRRVSWQHGHAGCQGAERRSKYSGRIRKHAAGSRHSDSVQFYSLYLRYVHLYMLLHTSRFQQKHPASHPSPRSSHAVMLF